MTPNPKTDKPAQPKAEKNPLRTMQRIVTLFDSLEDAADRGWIFERIKAKMATHTQRVTHEDLTR